MTATASAKKGGFSFSQRSLATDPLLDCLFSLVRGFGMTATRESLTAGIPLHDNRLTPSMFARSARQHGLVTRVLRRDLSQFKASHCPAVLLLENDEACILRGVREGFATVSSSDLPDAADEIPLEELAGRYTGIAILVKPRYHFDKRTPELASIRTRHWFWQAIFQCKTLYRDALVAALMINIFALAIPIVTMNIYDRVVPNMATDTLWVLAIGAALVLVFDFLLKVSRAYLIDRASKRVDINLSALIMERVLGIRMAARPASVGAFAANLRAFETIRDFIASASVTALIDMPFLLLFMIVIAWISPWMVLPLLAGAMAMIVYALLMQHKMEELSETTLRASSQRNALLVESLAALETVKIQGAEGSMQTKWEESTRFLAQVGSRLKVLSTSATNFAGFVQQFNSVAMLVVGVYQIMLGNLSMGGLIAVVMLSGRAIAPLGQVVGLLTQYHHAKTSLSSLESFMEMPVERDASSPYFHRTHLKGEIEFHDVSFAYPNSNMGALSHVSFRIHAGERVGIIGRTGSGKSTLQKLILGLFQADEGAISIDGIDIKQIDPSELRHHIGHVPQDAVLFYGSLRENIAFGKPHAYDASVAAAAEQAGLTDFINRHPDGFDMLIGERGESLSGGQRKAVTIARALLESPPILLLDEPTSNMDHASEQAIKRTLASVLPGKTLVLVTHHTALLDLVDRLIVIDQGRVVADGPRAEVVRALQGGKIGKAAV